MTPSPLHRADRPRIAAGRVVLTGGLIAMLGLMGAGRVLAVEPNATASLENGAVSAGQSSAGAAAEGGVSKREVVYGHLALNGAVEGLYVVNQFEHAPQRAVVDYGAYDHVRNLTDSAAIDAGADRVTFEGAGGPFSYEGTLKDRNLPWSIAVNYRLDGQSREASELGGATGALDLSIATTRNVAVNATYFDNYLLQITLTLPSKCAQNVTADAGQVAMAGSDYTITFMAMPGADGAFELSADVADFEMGAMSFAAVPLSFALESPDADDLVDGFEQLGDGVDELAGGANELAGGVDELASGLGQFGDGAGAVASGSDQTADGATALSDGAGALASGSEEIASGAAAVATNIHELATGLAQFQAALNANAASAESQAANSAPAAPDTSAIEGAIGAYVSAYSTAYASRFASAFASAYGSLVAGGAEPSAATTEATRQASSSAAAGAASDPDVRAAIASIGDAAERIATQAAETAGQAAGLQGAAQAMREAASGLTALAQGAEELAGGTDDLAAGSRKIAGGASDLATGTGALADGARQLADGANELADGAAASSSGARQLADGASQLAEGADTLAVEVGKMPDEVRAQIDEMLSSYDRSDYEPTSFASPRNTGVSLVQFVLSTDPITAPETEAPVEEEPEQSFIDRFLALFS